MRSAHAFAAGSIALARLILSGSFAGRAMISSFETA